MKRIIVAAIALALAGGPQLALANPSLADTDAWLQANLPALTFGDDGFDHVTTSATYAARGCGLRVSQKYEATKSSGQDDQTKYYRITFRPYPGRQLLESGGAFTKTTPENPDATMSYSTMETINLANIDLTSLRVVPVSLNGNQPETSAAMLMFFAPKEIFITSTDSDLVERSVKALRRAATLCGAKASAF